MEVWVRERTRRGLAAAVVAAMVVFAGEQVVDADPPPMVRQVEESARVQVLPSRSRARSRRTTAHRAVSTPARSRRAGARPLRRSEMPVREGATVVPFPRRQPVSSPLDALAVTERAAMRYLAFLRGELAEIPVAHRLHREYEAQIQTLLDRYPPGPRAPLS